MKTVQKHINQLGWGILLAAAIALSAKEVASYPVVAQAGLSALTLAIVIGMILGNTVFQKFAVSCGAGIDFSKTRLLRLGIVLYGFRITYQQIASIGWRGVVIDILMIALTFTLAVWLGTRVFKLDRETSMLIGAGSSICGAAAVLATEPIDRCSQGASRWQRRWRGRRKAGRPGAACVRNGAGNGGGARRSQREA